MAIAAIIFVLIAGLFLIPTIVYGQDREPTKEEIIQANYSGPVYLDSFWTSGSIGNQTGEEIDVGPGDGTSTLAVVLINRGPSDIAGITGRLSLPDDFKATGKATGVPAVATFNQIAKVGNPFVLFFDVDILDDAAVGEYSAHMQVDYSRFFETGKPRTVEMNVLFKVTGEPIVAVTNAADSNQIVAGKIENYTFNVANSGTGSITNVVISMQSPSDSLKILGNSKWNIQRINEDSEIQLTTRAFAATSLIGNPASFDVKVEYSSNGQPKIESFTLGTYVAGEISIRAYDIEVNYIGGSPNIVGSLLNEGNTVALFSTIKITEAVNLVSDLPPSQYIGDLEENSPLPFSIPLEVDSNSSAGTYPVSLEITYKDDLRELRTVNINSEVQFAPERPADESTQNSSMTLALPIGIGAAIAVAIVIAAALRSRKKTALRRTIQAGKHDEDIEAVLDSHNKKDDRK